MSNQLIKDRKPVTNKIRIDDGSKVYDIENRRGETIGQFVFTPSDMGIVERYEHTIEVLNSMQDRLKKRENDDNVLQLKKEVEEELKNEIDYLYNADVSGAFFKKISPLSPLESGELYVENIIYAVRDIVEKETGKRLGRANNRASKYTQKYRK
ncbi:hypothetical protein [Clostridium sp. HBUAS56010]|uniref:hypothetical protein n=1 Tax=Clostridium sp. HBUAS56010 TaxID=2571127 RepID=UPI0011788C56|nr:hypothetical protein [Clostridium sp. HBUAS56010]